jgi:hypothetical protein
VLRRMFRGLGDGRRFCEISFSEKSAFARRERVAYYWDSDDCVCGALCPVTRIGRSYLHDLTAAIGHWNSLLGLVVYSLSVGAFCCEILAA